MFVQPFFAFIIFADLITGLCIVNYQCKWSRGFKFRLPRRFFVMFGISTFPIRSLDFEPIR